MKKFIYILISSVLLFGCDVFDDLFQNTTEIPIEVTLEGLPSNYNDYTLKVTFWDEDSNVIKTISKDESMLNTQNYTYTLDSPESFHSISFFLYSNNYDSEPKYFMEYLYSETEKYTSSYWLSYYDYFYLDENNFGVSITRLEDLGLNQSTTLNLEDAPYFILKYDNLGSNENYNLKIETTHSIEVFTGDSYSEVISNYSNTLDTLNENILFTEDVLYILIKANDLTESGFIYVSINEFSQEELFKSTPVNFSKLFYANDQKLYGFYKTNEDFIVIDPELLEVTVIKTFDSSISDMCLIENDGTILIAEGVHLWKYTVLTGVLETVYNGAALILSLFPAGDYIISNENYGAWSTYALLDLETFTSWDTKEWVKHSFSSVYSSSLSTVYRFRDGTSPNDIEYQIIDTATSTLGDKGDSPYHTSSGIVHPLKIYPNEDYIMVGSGNVYYADHVITLYGNLGFSYNEAIFNNGKIYLVNDDKVVSINQNDFLDYTIMGEFAAGETGEFIFLTDNTLNVLVQDSSDFSIRFIDFDISENNDSKSLNSNINSSNSWRDYLINQECRL